MWVVVESVTRLLRVRAGRVVKARRRARWAWESCMVGF